MPVKRSAYKALRQDKKRTERNKIAKLEVKDARRDVRKALEAGEVEKAREAAAKAVQLLDKAYGRGVLKQNTVARHKSRLLKKVNEASAKK